VLKRRGNPFLPQQYYARAELFTGACDVNTNEDWFCKGPRVTVTFGYVKQAVVVWDHVSVTCRGGSRHEERGRYNHP
jgi:hypothetical protein